MTDRTSIVGSAAQQLGGRLDGDDAPTGRLLAGPVVSMRGVAKDFGGVRVLNDVDLEVHPGEVVALVGENGAGKSTLIKILTGLYTASEGTIDIDGQPVVIRNPADAERLGIRVIHQDRHLAGRLTVAEQLFLGSRSAFVTGRQLDRRTERELLDLVGLDVPGSTLVDELSVAEQQLLQLAIATITRPRILVLDEPTAPLAAGDVDRLFRTVRALQSQGVAVIYISHYLQEVRDIASRVIVLRNGERVGALDLADPDSTLDAIVQLMVGRSVEEFGDRDRVAADAAAEAVLGIDGLTVADRLHGVSIAVRPGEIVGVTGLVGSGIEELADAVTGLRAHGGTVRLRGTTIRSPRAFVRSGGAYVPANRHRDGILNRQSVRENLTIAALDRITGLGGMLRGRRERSIAADLVQRLDVRPANDSAVAGSLSGGNQQKVVLGRWLAAGSTVFVLDQPTSGVDIGSRQQIYAEIDALVAQGAGVLLVSVDLEELIGLSDRVLVLYRGTIRAELPRSRATADSILAWSTGAAEAGPPTSSGSGDVPRAASSLLAEPVQAPTRGDSA
ncbi:MAG TPA: sugar ABC transporter ATP-binding protein [Plantibacter sp.]|uniref:sugar ABC transporter ATP-binding protein n=1 Tax=Plantibacter sp. TaxID=1871045 RepID=UPI002C555E37|nr:sugar ABC transporter ATP-binding protein [Plantibacter sp.]